MESKTATFDQRWVAIGARFAHRMRTVRSQRGLSQAQLGAMTGLTRFAVGDIESGARQARLPEAVFICEALGVGLGDMLGDVDPVLVVEQRIEFRPHAGGSR